MRSNWYIRSLNALESAKLLANEGIKTGKQLLINNGGFFTQQAIEYMYKFYLASYGYEPPKTHDLVLLDSWLKRSDINVPFTEYIINNLHCIGIRESKTRYGDNFSINESQIKKTFDEIDKSFENIYQDLIERHILIENEEEMEK